MRHYVNHLSIQVDDSDRHLIKEYKWSLNIHEDTQYLVTRIDGRKVRLHQLILGFPKYPVAHKNGNTLDNRRENLVPRSSMSRGTVYRNKNSYVAKMNGVILGYRKTRTEALTLLCTPTNSSTNTGNLNNIPASAAYVDKFEDEVGPVPGCTNFMYNCDELNLYGSTLSCDNCLLHYYKERVK